jgi:carboxymethylenebutenolidase
MEISSEMVGISSPTGVMQCLHARPATPGPHPAVIVVMEAFGLNGHIKDVAKRFAAEGYVAVAPDMYHREKNAVVGYDDLPAAIRLMSGLADDGIVEDVAAVVGHLQGAEHVRADRIGITGFCMGGRITFLAACTIPALAAAVPFYGGGIGGLLDRAKDLGCPALLFFGDKDAFIPKDEVDRIRATLADLGKPAEVRVYAGAEHGFFCDERSSYNPEAARDSWKRALDFFARHLR